MGAIRLERVNKIYPGDVHAVNDVDLEIAAGEFMVLVGPSGCGKSTLLRMMAGLEEITSGSLFIGDREVTNLSPRDRDVAMVFQNYALYPHMTVAAEPRLRPEGAQDAEGDDRRARQQGREAARARGPARAPPGRALGRAAPAGGDGARDRARACGIPDGRAALQPRRQAAGRDAGRADPAAQAAQRDDGVRDPRPGRGDDARPAGRRHARRVSPAGRHAAGSLPPPEERVRRCVHRVALDEPRRGDDREREGVVRRIRDPAARRGAAGRAPSSSASVLRTSRTRRSRTRHCRRSRSRRRSSRSWARSPT